ncbi:protein angel homolog 2 [Pholidichthys leucotaenia]
MRSYRDVPSVSSTDEENHLMFLHRLSCFGSSLPGRSHPALFCAASSFLHPHFNPSPHPWWSVRGFPRWPPRLQGPPPSAHPRFPGRALRPRNINPGYFGRNWRSVYTSVAHMMERHDGGGAPPYKRKRSVEERMSPDERDGHRGGESGGSREDSSHGPNHSFKEQSEDGVKNGAEKGWRRENSPDKNVERTKTVNKDRQRKGGSPNQGRIEHQQGGRKDSQPAGHKPNPWFKERSAQEPSGLHRKMTGPTEQLKEGSLLPSYRPNVWNVVRENMEPPPPEVSPPVRALQRYWESCSSDLQPPGDSSSFDFSVMSYNILSQQLLLDNAYLYRHCDPAVLPWEFRLTNLLAEIKEHSTDILCLQEVQEDHYENQIKPALQALGYQCEYKRRTGRKPDGCAVAFKTSRFSLLSSNPVEFLRPGDALLDRDNVGLVVQLQPSGGAAGQWDPSSFICVANTHLLYNPRRGDVKLAQLAILLAEINRLSHLPDGSTSPVVLCGDLNSVPFSPLYSFLTTGSLDYQGMQIGMVSGQENSPRGQRLLTSPIWSQSLGINQQCQYETRTTAESPPKSPTAVEGAISNLSMEELANRAAAAVCNRARIEHGLKLQSSYQHRLMPDGRPEITTCHSRTALTVDYILHSPDFVSPLSPPGGRGLQLLSRLSLVGQSELEEVNGLPNQSHSSDHLPLIAYFRFRS